MRLRAASLPCTTPRYATSATRRYSSGVVSRTGANTVVDALLTQIEQPQFAFDALGRRVDLRDVGHVDGNARHAGPGSTQLGACRFHTLGVSRQDGHPVAAARERVRGRAPDAGRCARDDDDVGPAHRRARARGQCRLDQRQVRPCG
jgi:hypothetical protein